MLFSDPNLSARDGDAVPVPLRVQPGIGEWGPEEVVTARARVRRRALAPLAFMTVVMAILTLGTWLFWQLQTGPISEGGAVVVAIGKFVVPIIFVASLVTTVVVWILGRPYRRSD